MHFFFSNPIKKLQYLLILFDAVIVFTIFIFTYILKIIIYEGGSIAALSERVPWLVIIAVFLHLISFYIFELYNIEFTKTDFNLFFLTILSVLLAFGLIALTSYAFPYEQVGRVILIIHVPLLIMVIFLWRKLFFYILSKRNGNFKKNILTIGNKPSFEEVLSLLKKYQVINYNLVDAIPIIKTNPLDLSSKDVGYNMDLESFVHQNDVNIIVTGERLENLSKLKKQLLNLRIRGITIYDYYKFYEHLTGKVLVSYTGENCLIFSNQGRAYNPFFYIKIKRVCDLILSVAGILLSFPFFIVIAIAIKLNSKGPVFFKQERLGLDERPFTLIKFRTMIDKAEEKNGPQWASVYDLRITKVGKLLRKTHLDELPQLINILKGDMSFVGPRPFRKYFIDLLSEKFPCYRLRLTAKPGLTGWAQVRGNNERTEEKQIENLEYDLFYIQNRSTFLDLFIITKTIQTVLFRRGE